MSDFHNSNYFHFLKL